LRKYRPEFDFDALVLSDQADVRSKVDVGRTAVSQKSDPLFVSKDMIAPIRLMVRPEFRSAITNFQTEFEAASAQIDILADYKLAHDLFQELESSYFLIKNDERRLPDDDAWDSISLNEPELHAKINELLNVIKRPTFTTDDTHWGQQLEKARDQIRLGVEELDVNQLQTGVRLIYRILSRQPARLNAQIVATAGMIRQDSIENAVNTILDGLLKSGIESNQVPDELKQGAQELVGMNERLNRLVQEHNGWQEIDDELRRVEASMDQNIHELEFTWFDLSLMLRDLIEPSSHEEWAAQLLKVVEAMDEVVAEDTAVKVNRQFRRLRSFVGRRFRQVDLELLSLLRDLQMVGESLDLLLRSLG
ncbi:MAG: hypothetical protein KC421_16850, partial [Anaerolineales bacterium]|nr:hypothetical protein [Anaerolineales bacterium]